MTRSLKSVLAVISSCGLALAAQAATDQESVLISATVGDILDIQMIDDSGATGPAETMGYLATIRVLSNDPNGFTMTVTSAGSGVLTRQGGSETIDHFVYFEPQSGAVGPDQPGNFPLGVGGQTQLTAPLVMNFDTNVSPTDVTWSFLLELGAFVGQPAGDYTDTITFDLADTN